MTATLLRRLTGIALAAATVITFTVAARPATVTQVVVYKSPTCGCCTKWVDYLRKQGFAVAIVGGYVIEGHVPAADIERLLKEHPKIVGLTVPGMVTGSPGMEGGTPEHYQVLAFDARGKTTVFSKY
jgi:hypothetical protein